MKSIFYSLISQLGFALIKLAAKAKTRDKCANTTIVNCEKIQNLTFMYLIGKDEDVKNYLRNLNSHSSLGDDSMQLINTDKEVINDD